MADDSIRVWAEGLLRKEERSFERARRRFIRRATAENLHYVRTTARKLRSLLDDMADIIDAGPIRDRIKPLIKATGSARDAAVIREALRAGTDEAERDAIRPFLRELRLKERRGRRKSRRRARTAELP